MATMFHPYRKSSNSNRAGHLSATRSTLRRNDGAEDDELFYLRETASSTAQALPVLNLSKRGSSMKTPSPPSTSSNKTSSTESVVAAKQETEEITIKALDVIDEDDSEDNNSTAASPTPSNVVSYQSGPSRHRRPRVSRTQASGSVPDLGAAGRSNEPCGTQCSSPVEIAGGGATNQPGLIRTHHAIPKPFPPAMPSPYAPVRSIIAVRTANLAKKQWNISGPAVVIAHNFTDYFVGKRLFSYVAVLKTPIGDVTANFSPYYGEVGMFNAGHAMFPPLVYKDVVRRKDALHTVYARVCLHPHGAPGMIWQKARVISRPGQTPKRVRLLHGPFTNFVFSAVDLLPCTQASYAAIVRGGNEWKTVAIPPQTL